MNISEIKRLILEAKIQEELQRGIKQVRHPFKAFFIFGPAGAGKTFIKEQLGLPDSFISVNTDEAVEQVFPKFDLSLSFDEGPQQIKQELRKLLQQATFNQTQDQVNKCKPLLFDTPGEKTGKIYKIVRALVDIGYDVALFQINVPPDYSVESDLARGTRKERSVGPKRTRNIANTYQKRVVGGGAYYQLGQERGVTLISDKIYPNIFDLRTGEIRPDFNLEKLQQDKLELKDPSGKKKPEVIRNPFQGITWKEASGILEEAKVGLSEWLSGKEPENATGKTLYSALSYIQDQGVNTLGNELTDVPQYAGYAAINDIEIPRVVEEALYLTVNMEKKISKTTPKEKSPEYDPRYSPLKVPYKGPAYTKPGAPTAKDIVKEEQVELRELRDFISKFNKKNSI
jgi:hypothetical protein